MNILLLEEIPVKLIANCWTREGHTPLGPESYAGRADGQRECRSI
uniref:Uncharacterized protein n=1 Tax=Aegilops tauschii subsp. strangulata TaxID=200361 RepID=A0A453PNK3_AEGTS